MRFEIFRGILLRQLYYNSLGGHSSKEIDKCFTVVEKQWAYQIIGIQLMEMLDAPGTNYGESFILE